mgnify:CR=1 FL=1
MTKNRFDEELERQKKLLEKMTAKEMIDEMNEIHGEIMETLWNSHLTPVLMLGVLEEIKGEIRRNIELWIKVLKDE